MSIHVCVLGSLIRFPHLSGSLGITCFWYTTKANTNKPHIYTFNPTGLNYILLN